MRSAPLFTDLKRTNDPSRIAWVHSRGSFWIKRTQALQQSIRPVMLEFAFDSLPNRRVARRKVKVVDHARDVKPGSAHEDRVGTGQMDLLDHCPSPWLVPRNRGVFVYLSDIKEVMRNISALRLRNFCGADVHAPIELHRISIDNLSCIAARPKCQCEIDSEIALSCARRPGDYPETR